MQLINDEALFLNGYLSLDIELGSGKVREWTFYKGRQYGLFEEYGDISDARNAMWFYRRYGGFPSCSPHYYPWDFGVGKVRDHRRIEYDKNSDS